MFCYQCEQAAKGTGCDIAGVCGKQPETAALQDYIVAVAPQLGYAVDASPSKERDTDVERYVLEALFETVTNVNFDPERLEETIRRGHDLLKSRISVLSGAENDPLLALEDPAETLDELIAQGARYGILQTHEDPNIRSLHHLLLYGLKGMAAYADHALILGKEDEEVFAFFYRALAALHRKEENLDTLLALCLECGTVNIRAMELLDNGHVEHFGHPEPTVVSTGKREGPAIVVSGHDLLDLEALLKQTEGTGINVYTHGEMLPAHGYPELKKYPHLAGHFGTAWQNQQKEFAAVNAVFLFTTNCIQKPRESYRERIFTTGLVGWPGVTHLPNRDFSACIVKAKEAGGFREEPGGTLTTGFGRTAVLSQAQAIVEAVQKGAVRHFFLVGGCDGTKPGRNYYTEFAEATPADTIILTLACGKFRINHLDLGEIGGIPRILDVGQCNDAYSAIVIASALAEAFNTDVNGLPLSLVLSWYEQKAVVILLSLLSLGIKNIRIGPSLPAFLSPDVLSLLVEKYNLTPIGTAREDLEEMLQK